MDKKYKGSSFDGFLEEEKLLDDVKAVAVERVRFFEFEKNELDQKDNPN